MKSMFFICLIMLILNVFRFLLGNIGVFMNNTVSIYLKIWNLIESITISIVLIILIINYYK